MDHLCLTSSNLFQCQNLEQIQVFYLASFIELPRCGLLMFIWEMTGIITVGHCLESQPEMAEAGISVAMAMTVEKIPVF